MSSKPILSVQVSEDVAEAVEKIAEDRRRDRKGALVPRSEVLRDIIVSYLESHGYRDAA